VPTMTESASEPVSKQEQSALVELTRAVALALGDNGLRQQVSAYMRTAGVTQEFKLHLGNYVRGNGGLLLARMAQRTGKSRDALLGLVNSVRPLEFYVPVAEHRARWTGEGVIVAAQLRETDPIIGFRVDGTPVELSLNEPPDSPTLALVPVETDFSQASQVAQGPSLSMAPDPYDGSGGGTPSGVVPSHWPTGLYMTYSDVYNDGEHWIKGSPEIEAHVIGPGPDDAPDYARSITCASQSGSGYRWFDQNKRQWSGAVQLLNAQDFEVNRFVDTLPDNRSYFVALYEDDDTRCVIRDDPNRVPNQLAWLATWVGVGALNVLACEKAQPNSTDAWLCSLGIVGSIVSMVKALWGLIQTNDDYLGLAFVKQKFPDYVNASASHVLVKDPGDTRNGGIKLVYHRKTS
jgi:hypothetical protein